MVFVGDEKPGCVGRRTTPHADLSVAAQSAACRHCPVGAVLASDTDHQEFIAVDALVVLRPVRGRHPTTQGSSMASHERTVADGLTLHATTNRSQHFDQPDDRWRIADLGADRLITRPWRTGGFL